MRRNIFALLRTFVFAAFVPALAFSLVSCEPENGDGTVDGGENGDEEDTTSEIAVTGLVDKFGCTYADISGYANLNLLPAGSGNPVIGVEVVEAKAESNENAVQSTSGSLTGNIFTASFSDLSPATEYKYRSFVTYGGITYYGNKYNTFTTKEVINLTSASEASEVTMTSAILSTAVQTEGVDARDGFYIGLAWSTSESAICAGGDYDSRTVSVREVQDGVFSASLSGLSVNTTYYYASFTEVGGVYVFSSVKNFMTGELANLVGEVEVSEITRKSAVLSASVQAEGVDARDNVSVGLAWSTTKDAIRADGNFESRQISVQNVEDGEFTVSLNDLSVNTTYYFASFTLVGGVYVFSSVKEFTTDVLRLETGAVDLGLSVKWAGYNVGADSPEEYGDYFAWGETTTKSSYYSDNSVTYGLSISKLESRGIIGSDGNLTAAYDAATANWGSDWRMPTLDEMKELINECEWEWTSVNGVKGRLVTGPNGNSIFLPAAGYRSDTSLYDAGSYGEYWSATPDSYSYYAYYLRFNSGNSDWSDYNRLSGRVVRPVSEK